MLAVRNRETDSTWSADVFDVPGNCSGMRRDHLMRASSHFDPSSAWRLPRGHSLSADSETLARLWSDGETA